MADKNYDLRNIVLKMLSKVYDESAFANTILNEFISGNNPEAADKNFVTMLFWGTIEKTVYLDHILDLVSKTPVKKMKPVIRNILRMSLYQIIFMDSVPDHAAVSEALRLCEKRKISGLKGFVNAVLRNAIKNDHKDMPEHVLYSVPEWIYDEIIDTYGKEKAKIYFEAISSKEKNITALIMNEDIEQVKKSLKDDGCETEDVLYMKDMIKISGFSSIESLHAFSNGDIFIQDISSALTAKIAASVYRRELKGKNPETKGPDIIDVCAAPGGKSIGLSKEFPDADIHAFDISDKKTALIKENIKRLNIDNIRPLVCDARKPLNEFKSSADIVICDLPCSGLGVAGKKSDIFLRLKSGDIDALAELQTEILEKSIMYLKKGGILIFSTCTVTEKENINNFLWLSKREDLKSCSLEGIVGEGLIDEDQKERLKEGFLQLLCGINDMDGFFISAFIKK